MIGTSDGYQYKDAFSMVVDEGDRVKDPSTEDKPATSQQLWELKRQLPKDYIYKPNIDAPLGPENEVTPDLSTGYGDRITQAEPSGSVENTKHLSDNELDDHLRSIGYEDPPVRVASMIRPPIESMIKTESDMTPEHGYGIPAAGPGRAVTIKPMFPNSEVSAKDSKYPAYNVLVDDKPVGELTFSKKSSSHYVLEGAYRTLNEDGSDFTNQTNSLGPSVVRGAFKEFLKEHPNTQYISAMRVSGARNNEGSGPEKLYFKVNDGRLKLTNKDEFSRTLRESLDAEKNTTTRDITAEVDPTESSYARVVRNMAADAPAPVRSWLEQRLRTEGGQFMSPSRPLAETGPAQFRNARREYAVRRQDAPEARPQMPLAEYGPAAFRRAMQRMNPPPNLGRPNYDQVPFREEDY